MIKTSDSNACPKCGAPVPPEAPQGLCPQCVFVQAAAPEAAPTATSQIPSLERLAIAFPQLQILELIGRGGMGFVFKARQPHLDRFVALKLLPDSLAHDAHFAERFNREGRTLARLNHPNIVSIFDFGQAGGFYFLLMEYVDGVNLRQAMQAGRFSPSEALAIVPKICEALQFAHEEGILHRDIKPENILLDSKGRVKIADFGIAKIVGEDKPDISLTATGAALGTPHYMAPEQFEKPATVDHRADIYSLGVVFYEMLTGELPIGRFSPPSQRTPVDPRVDDVVMRTLEKEREKRFQSAGEMRTNVENLTEAGAGSFKAAPPREPSTATAAQGPLGTIVIGHSSLVKRPAQALLLTGVLNWIGSIIVVGLLAYTAPGQTWILSPSQLAAVGALILISSSVIIMGALKMMKMEAYPLAVAASVLAMITTPGSIIGLPIGLWALFTLRRPEVRAGFNSSVVTPTRGVLKWACLVALVVAVGFVLVSRKVASTSQATNPAFGTVPGELLPEGTIELVAVSQHPFDTNWWQPNGASWTGARLRTWGVASQADSSQRFVGFVFRFADSDFNNSSVTYRFAGSRGWGTGVVEIDRRPSRNHGFAAAAFPAAQQTTTIHVGVATDPWETLASDASAAGRIVSFSRQNRPVKITFVQATEENFTNTVLTVTHNLEGENIRVLAIDVEGSEHLSTFPRFMGEHLTATFALPLRQVREFQFQARPYRWMEFKNVQLQPLGSRKIHDPNSVTITWNAQANAPFTLDNLAYNTNIPPLRLNEDPTPWIRFTFTAVELRELKGVRWLAIDYLDDVHGECQKSFPWETTIPGFKAETRATEFVTDAKDSSPAVRHQRIEYRMPDSSPREQLERLRDELEKTLKQKSFRLELGENQVPLTLFELPGVEGGSLKARIKVMPPLKVVHTARSTVEATEGHGPLHKIQLIIPTIADNPYDSVSVATESELPMGVYPVVLLRRPDGRIEEHPPVTTINTGSGRTRVVRHLLWSLSLIESNQVREIVTDMRATMHKRVVELKVDGRARVFHATNDQGATTDGFIALRSQDFSATNPPAVTISIVDGAPQNWSSFLSVKLRISAPSGYLPNAVGLRGDGSALETRTWINGDASGDFCYWYLPPEFQASDIQEIVRQLESTKVTSPIGIRLLPGQRVPVFSVTNRTGTIFRGYFELPTIAGTK